MRLVLLLVGGVGKGLGLVDFMLFLHQAVDVVLGAMFGRRHLEHKCHTEQGLVCFLVGDDLRNRKMTLSINCSRIAHRAQRTCRMVKFSSTLFIMYFSGRCFSLLMKLIM